MSEEGETKAPEPAKDCAGDGTGALSHHFTWEHSEPGVYDFCRMRCQRCGGRKEA